MSEERYYAALQSLPSIASLKRTRHRMSFLYDGIDFSGKSVIDIGGGMGLHSLYAAARGAESVLMIEPEGDGGHSSMIANFHSLRDAMGFDNVELLVGLMQDFDPAGKTYDIVLIQDAINHFDEPACVTLTTDPASRERYEKIFASIAALLKPGGTLIMSDCSSKNFFDAIGLQAPFAKEIEWEKHQPPQVWADVARPQGLELTKVRWSSPTRFGEWGQKLLGSSLAAWFFTSHFVMNLTKR